MNLDDLKNVLNKVCPDMLSNDTFMKHATNKYCNGEFVNARALSDNEYKAWMKLREVIRIATVGQLIKHLKENFKLTEKLCYMDCIEGYKNDCTYVTKDQLGKKFFYYVKDIKEQEDNMFPYVDNNNVVVA